MFFWFYSNAAWVPTRCQVLGWVPKKSKFLITGFKFKVVLWLSLWNVPHLPIISSFSLFQPRGLLPTPYTHCPTDSILPHLIGENWFSYGCFTLHIFLCTHISHMHTHTHKVPVWALLTGTPIIVCHEILPASTDLSFSFCFACHLCPMV